MSSKEGYEKKLAAQLAEVEADVDKLKAKARQAEADAQIELNRKVEMLKAKRDTAKKQLDSLRASGDDAWTDLKDGVQSAFDELGNAVKDARARF